MGTKATKSKLSGSTALTVPAPKAVKPTDLKALAAKIGDDLARREKSRAEWIVATADLCRHFAEARAKFKDNKSFGDWFDKTGIAFNKNDRAAAIAMGEELERAKRVLESTERISLRLIHDKEFRLPTAGKTTRSPKAPAKPQTPVTIEGEIVPQPAAVAPADANDGMPEIETLDAMDRKLRQALVDAFKGGELFGIKAAASAIKEASGGPSLGTNHATTVLKGMMQDTGVGYVSEVGKGGKWRLAPAPEQSEPEAGAVGVEDPCDKIVDAEFEVIDARAGAKPTPLPPPTPAVDGMVPLADIERYLNPIAKDLDRLAKREGIPAIETAAKQLRDLITAWRGDFTSDDVVKFLTAEKKENADA